MRSGQDVSTQFACNRPGYLVPLQTASIPRTILLAVFYRFRSGTIPSAELPLLVLFRLIILFPALHELDNSSAPGWFDGYLYNENSINEDSLLESSVNLEIYFID